MQALHLRNFGRIDNPPLWSFLAEGIQFEYCNLASLIIKLPDGTRAQLHHDKRKLKPEKNSTTYLNMLTKNNIIPKKNEKHRSKAHFHINIRESYTKKKRKENIHKNSQMVQGHTSTSWEEKAAKKEKNFPQPYLNLLISYI